MPGADENLPVTGAGAQAGNGEGSGQVTNDAPTQQPQTELTPDEMKAEIAKLRKENASRRTTAKNLEDRLQTMEGVTKQFKAALGIVEDEEKPEVVASKLRDHAASLEMELGIHKMAMANNVAPEHLDYFGYLFRSSLGGLEEGQEFGEEDLGGILEKLKAVNGLISRAPATTGVKPGAGNGSGSGAPPAGTGANLMTVEKFVKLNVYEKGDLYKNNPDQYSKLFAEAKSQGKI